jgi:hypothetical protein
MSERPPLRYKPRKDRIATWIALGVTALIFAILLGWVASSVYQERQRLAASDDIKAEKSITQNSELDSTISAAKKTASEIAKPTPESKPAARAEIQTRPLFSTDGKTSNGNRRKDGSDIAKGSTAGEKKKRSGPLKLSDLPSYKKEPEPKRFGGDAKSDSKKISKDAKNVTINKKPEPEIDVGKRNDVGFDNQNILPQSDSEIRIYQELTVNRNPTFSMAGLSEFKQEFKFRTVSEILIKPGDKNGFRAVVQKIVHAKLLSSDSISKKSLEESVKELPGKIFTYTLDRRQKLMDFKGEADKPKTLDLKDLTSISGFTGEGMMMSSVMDLDGWREMAQLTFLLPDDKKKKWTDQMGHDWGDLGKWTGETKFEKKSKTNGLQRIDYAHHMTYVPNFGKTKLPFKIDSMRFNSSEAGGRLFFDEKKKRINSLIERFKVNGELSASLLGSSITMTMSETQTFELSLHDQQPQ